MGWWCEASCMVSLELRELGEVLEKLGLLQRRPLRQCWAFASEEGDNVFSRFCDERPGRGSRAVPECDVACVSMSVVTITPRLDCRATSAP